MRAEHFSVFPHCTECPAVWLPSDLSHWRAYVIDDGPDDKLVFYCRECAEREFDA